MTARDTRERILDHAERLFAEQGFDRASLRSITDAAEVNLAAVNYHFGSKADLLGAVLERRIGPINAERIRLLDQAAEEAKPELPRLRTVLECFLRPAVEMLGDVDPTILMGLGRILHERGEEARGHFDRLFANVAERFLILARICPELAPEEIHARFHFMIGAMLHSTVQVGPAKARPRPVDPELRLAQLLAFVEADFIAPPAKRESKGIELQPEESSS